MEPYYQDESVVIYHGDCREVVKTLAENSIDSIVTDPPYELGFMGKGWDRSGIAYDVSVWRECLRVLKPGGHLLAFGGSRTYHRLACAIEDAGFEIRDQIQWIYGCLSDDTEILINGRWEPYHKAIKGSLALCYNMGHDTLEWQPVQELFVYQYSDTAYRVESDSTDQIVSRNHRCIVERSGAYTFSVAEEAAREQQARIPVLEDVSALLDALPVWDQRAGYSEQDLRTSLRDSDDKQTTSTLTQAPSALSMVQEGISAFERDSVGGREDVRLHLPRSVEAIPASMAGAPENNCGQGPRWMDRRIEGFVQSEDERRKQSSLERRGNSLSEARELCADQVCEMPSGVPADGPQGRLRDGAPLVSGPSNRAVFTPSGDGSPRRSRSFQQSVDELPFVRVEPRSQTVRASRFTRPDLARITPFHYDGAVWCVRVPSGAFVARRNGKVFITGNSGFPKSLDVSKAIDRMRDDNAERRAVGYWLRQQREAKGMTQKMVAAHWPSASGGLTGCVANWELGLNCPTWDQWLALKAMIGLSEEMDTEVWRLNGRKGKPGDNWGDREVIGLHEAPAKSIYSQRQKPMPAEVPISLAATDAAKQWNGWGTALKPAHEPIVLARKPLIGTVAENVLQHGTGGLNIDGCRIGTFNDGAARSNTPGSGRMRAGGSPISTFVRSSASEPLDENQGRWPANVITSYPEDEYVLRSNVTPEQKKELFKWLYENP